jgi:hypothetical protein
MKTSKDFAIYKIRVYTSPYYLKKFQNNEQIGLEKQYEAAGNYWDFFWKFIKMITNKTSDYYFDVYGLSASECVIEEIHEQYGIIITNGEGWNTYLIPNDMGTFIIKWIEDNAPKYKRIYKTYSTYVEREPTIWKREHYLKTYIK